MSTCDTIIEEWGILECLLYNAIEDYLEDEQIDQEKRDEMNREVIETGVYEYTDWNEMIKYPRICKIAYMALQRWEDRKFKNSGLSISRIGDVRSMLSDVNTNLGHFPHLPPSMN